VRSMSKRRTVREERGKQGRSKARGVTRDAAPQNFGRRTKKPGPFARMRGAIKSWFHFRRPMLMLTAGLLALTALAALFASGVIGRTIHKTTDAASSFFNDAGFGVAEVHLTGNQRTPAVTVMAALGLRPGQSIFSVDLPAARMRLMQLPWVAEAEVKRRYPDDLLVTIVEKLPYARWQTPDGRVFVVERTGGLITDKGTDVFAKLPLLVGDGAPQVAAPFVDEVAQHRAIVARTAAYQYQSARRWNLLFDDGVIVKLPETGWQQQLSVLDHLIVDEGVLERDLAEIDLRSPTHYFFVTKSKAEKKPQPEAGSAI
jgi:cell division protein FtsQ